MPTKMMFRFGPTLESTFPPFDYHWSGQANILEPFTEERAHRAKCVAKPPNGYGSIVFPKRAVVGKQYEVTATFPPAAVDASDRKQKEWWDGLDRSARATFPVQVTLTTTDAFDRSDRVQKLKLGKTGRVVATNFLVRPLESGKHTLRVELEYPGAEEDASFSQTVKVRTRLLDVLQKAGIVVGLIVGVLSLLTVVGWL